MERGGGGKSPKGSRHLQGKRKKESQKEKKKLFSSLMFIAPRGEQYLRYKIAFVYWESYSYILIKIVKSLFNIFLCKKRGFDWSCIS
jgi:hypothetical protein